MSVVDGLEGLVKKMPVNATSGVVFGASGAGLSRFFPCLRLKCRVCRMGVVDMLSHSVVAHLKKPQG